MGKAREDLVLALERSGIADAEFAPRLEEARHWFSLESAWLADFLASVVIWCGNQVALFIALLLFPAFATSLVPIRFAVRLNPRRRRLVREHPRRSRWASGRDVPLLLPA